MHRYSYKCAHADRSTACPLSVPQPSCRFRSSCWCTLHLPCALLLSLLPLNVALGRWLCSSFFVALWTFEKARQSAVPRGGEAADRERDHRISRPGTAVPLYVTASLPIFAPLPRRHLIQLFYCRIIVFSVCVSDTVGWLVGWFT